MPRLRLPGAVVLSVLALAAACSRRALTADAGDVPDAVADGTAIDTADAPPATDVIRFCPLPGPISGQSCSDAIPGLVCFYGDAEPLNCSNRCECRDQSWICDRFCTTGADGSFDQGSDVVADAARDALAEGGVDGDGDGGGIPCGLGLTCFGTDICVTLNLCGGPVNCQYEPDGGECPAGSMLSTNCPSGRPGCIPDCPGPSYRCVPRPAACGAALSCACVTADICPFTTCISAQGRGVFCANS